MGQCQRRLYNQNCCVRETSAPRSKGKLTEHTAAASR